MAALRRLTTAALDLAFPAACSGCGREGPPLCASCIPALDARLDLPGGTPIGMPAEIPAPLLQLEWCAPFAGPVRDGLHDLKYKGERRLAEPFGAAVARRWSRVGSGAVVVVPVPVHADRERRRGYDQAALIAAVAARQLGLPLAIALERRRATIAQFELGRHERATNVEGAFAVRDAFRGEMRGGGGRGSADGRGRDAGPGAQAVAGCWVLLVDDVVTTGATLAACGTALRSAGAVAVSAIAVARER
jgi:predicted amidophosphoribosyltransferase